MKHEGHTYASAGTSMLSLRIEKIERENESSAQLVLLSATSRMVWCRHNDLDRTYFCFPWMGVAPRLRMPARTMPAAVPLSIRSKRGRALDTFSDFDPDAEKCLARAVSLPMDSMVQSVVSEREREREDERKGGREGERRVERDDLVCVCTRPRSRAHFDFRLHAEPAFRKSSFQVAIPHSAICNTAVCDPADTKWTICLWHWRVVSTRVVVS